MTARNCGGGAMYQRQKLAPLSPAEQDVAAQNFLLIERFIASRKLPRDEYFDVVVFGYLLAIKKWFNRPELYRYEFSTIAWAAMRNSACNERRKQGRRIKTVSLEDPIPGTNGMTWGDIITEENLVYSA